MTTTNNQEVHLLLETKLAIGGHFLYVTWPNQVDKDFLHLMYACAFGYYQGILTNGSLVYAILFFSDTIDYRNQLKTIIPKSYKQAQVYDTYQEIPSPIFHLNTYTPNKKESWIRAMYVENYRKHLMLPFNDFMKWRKER